MSKKLTNPQEMQIIYEVSKGVYDGKYAVDYALKFLKGKVSGTESSLEMYFKIYAFMREAKCYKMGTSGAYTKFLLNNIYRDFGEQAYINALSAAMGNYEYRKSVNNTQPSIVQACKESISECKSNVTLEEIIPASASPEKKRPRTISKRKKLLKSVEKIIRNEYLIKERDNEHQSITYNGHNNRTFDSNIMDINIQPSASILNVFSRLSYKPWYAIAEFVDNSTQSYISHKDELESVPDFGKLIVKVKYDAQNNSLTITDNAFGMEIDRFRDAILLDSRNDSQSGRNEFGMGLKTAASWFGKVWTVTSTQYGSLNRYTATVDIPKLEELHLQSIQIRREDVTAESHGTEIVISNVTKKITGSRTIAKIRDLLSSMYRRDINNNNIEISFNGEPIAFEDYPILRNFRGKTWKKELDFTVLFNEASYHVTGFVAIMNPGSFPKAGFALFRHDRVVIGGSDSNYKPVQIFGQAQSQRSLKLFGELNMNDFPVNQAKDGFVWDDGLEDTFVEVLKDNIQEYMEIADISRKERASEIQFSDQASTELQHTVSEIIDTAFNANNETENENVPEDTDKNTENHPDSEDVSSEEISNDINEYIETILNSQTKEETLSTVRSYTIPLSPVIKVNFSVQWSRCNDKYWVEYNELSTDNFEVFINIDHPFFMPFTKEEGFQKVLEKFALAFILAERQAKLGSDKQGYILSSGIKNYMNRYLEKLAEDK